MMLQVVMVVDDKWRGDHCCNRMWPNIVHQCHTVLNIVSRSVTAVLSVVILQHVECAPTTWLVS